LLLSAGHAAINPARQAHGSKPSAAECCGHMMGQMEKRTPTDT